MEFCPDAGIVRMDIPVHKPSSTLNLRDALNQAVSYHQSGDRENAEAIYRQILNTYPDHPDALHLCGVSLHQRGEHEEAEPMIRKAIGINPNEASYYSNLGVVLKSLNKAGEAVTIFRKALELSPDHIEARFNLAVALQVQGQTEDAIACYQEILKNNPDYYEAYFHLGVIYRDQEKISEAIAYLKKSLELYPEHGEATSSLLYQYQLACDWKAAEECAANLDKFNRIAEDKAEKPPETPFSVLTRTPDPAKAYKIAKAWCRDIVQSAAKSKPAFSFENRKRNKSKLTIGYVSADFCYHPVAQQILALFGLHNRNEFNIITYSIGPDDQSFYRRKIEKDSDQFFDVREKASEEIAKKIYDDEVDILVDLMGHTKGARLEIFAMRPAPIQMTWLGFPGTTGAEFMDYILTDKIVSPPEHAPYFSEKFVYMPYTYMMSDPHQPVSDKEWKRSDFGLPDNAFVFSSFNKPYKIEPVMFDVWMNILRQVPNSVLWLRTLSEMTQSNLRREAELRGVSSSRLFFSDKLPLKSDHLARLRLADLGLDTRIYNGHATSIDALWSGLPIITLQGGHFASRACSGFLKAAGLSELITHNLKEYESLAIELASQSEKLIRIRQKLSKNRLTSALFDAPAYVKHLESAYKVMWQIFASGHAPQHIEINCPNRDFQDSEITKIEEKSRQFLNPVNHGSDNHNHAEFQNALSLHQSGKIPEAEAIYRNILKNQPNHADALHFLGVIAYHKGNCEKSLNLIRNAISHNPNNPLYYSNLAIALKSVGKNSEAVDAYRKAVGIEPSYIEGYLNMGISLRQEGQIDQAIDAYEKILAFVPNHVDALYNIGIALQSQHRLNESVSYYRKAVAVKPDHARALTNMSSCLQSLGKLNEAISCLQDALKFEQHFETYYNLANLLKVKNKPSEAIACYRKVLELKPDYTEAVGGLTDQLQHICDWKALGSMFAQSDQLNQQALNAGTRAIETPFLNISRCDDLAVNLAVAKSWTGDNAKCKMQSAKCFHSELCTLNSELCTALTIGYVSNDFCNHPVAHLISGLFGLHDRSKFKVIGYYFGPEDHSIYHRKIRQDCDEFVNIRELSDEEAAKKISDDGADILVDLMGHTFNSRLGIFAYRPAPIQITWLGFPGTTGASYFDYILTDPIVTPPHHAPYYSEKFLYMPNCYQINDHQQAFAEKQWTRAELGIPISEDMGYSFVFCSFNQHFKIEPTLFDVWMNILKKVPNSVLWMLARNDVAPQNLKSEAQARGVDPNRLIFCEKIPKDEHLSRHIAADLVLDTKIYNGHTTTSDALWAGVPVIALMGNHFASRVAASLLTAVGLPELIAHSLQDYESLAIKLAANPPELMRIRQKLAKNRLTEPLFDTPKFVKDLERLYLHCLNRDFQDSEISRIEEKSRQSSDPVNHGSDNHNHGEFQNALSLHQSGKIPEAEAIYRNILKTQPNHADALHFLGVIENQRGNYPQAEMLMTQAIDPLLREGRAVPPAYFHNLATVYQYQKKFDQALACYQKTIQLDPKYALSYYNMGVIFEFRNQLESAIACYQKALQYQPNYPEAFTKLFDIFQQTCIWSPLPEMAKQLASFPSREGQGCAEMPLASITRTDDPVQNLAVAKSWSAEIERRMKGLELSIKSQTLRDKLRIGYLSNDFRNHPVAHLISGLFQLHNRQQFDIFCYSYGEDDGSEYCRKIQNTCENFRDIRSLNHVEAAKRIREDDIDILIDLTGHTRDNRMEICALRPAPIQISWLGFPGTSGADFFQCILTDRTVTPEDQAAYYTERFVYLPNSYLITDHCQKISDQRFIRADFGLPESGFVFCSFNQSFKIEPKIFDVWMNILKNVPNSVLWLRWKNDLAERNLRQAAEQRGVSKHRLIFSKKLPSKSDHLARHALADLALDTCVVNGHTTTSDALWAGVPVITLIGKHFASRVAASLLTSVGLPEFITSDLQAYQYLAIHLATHPHELVRIRQKLAKHRLTEPLFDTPRFAKDLEQCYREVWAEMLHALGGNYFQQKQYSEAEIIFRKVLEFHPNHFNYCNSLAAVLRELKKTDEAIVWGQKAVQLNPDYPAAYRNLGILYHDKQNIDSALSCYHKASELGDSDLSHNLGIAYKDKANSLFRMQEYKAAIPFYQKSLEFIPDNTQALYHLGLSFQQSNSLDAAISCYEKVLSLSPDNTLTYAVLYHQLQRICAWDKLAAMSETLDALTRNAIETQNKPDEAPLENIARSDAPALNLAVAKLWAKFFESSAKCKMQSAKCFHSPLCTLNSELCTVAYLSGDFRNHPVAHLCLRLFSLHDRSKFKVIAYSYSKHDGSVYRQTIEQDADEFVDISNMSHFEAAERISQDKVDILVDLTGYTTNARPEILALRPARIQISYLGFSGTMGADYVDYVITDRIVSPESYARYYSEKPAYMPNCYMITDDRQPISDKVWKRSDFNLPENAFVFCSFNQNLKIDPTIFDAWMAILRQVPHSVLWLIRENATSEQYLRHEAEKRGINPHRLIFKKTIVSKAGYLACLALADLALDTKIVNGHSTTADMLWAGLPVMTIQGRHFASRIASSLLTHIGLPELITQHLADYVSLAVKLATNSSELTLIRQKLAKNRLTEPLFDTPRFVKDLEKLYLHCLNRDFQDSGITGIEEKSWQSFNPVNHGSDNIQKALSLHQSGQLNEAQAIYSKIIEKYPEHSDALHLSGLIDFEHKNYSEAERKIQAAIRYFPDNAMYYGNLGAVFKAQNKLEDAIACYRRALRMDENCIEACFNLALALEEVNTDEAIQYYEQTLGLNPAHAKAIHNLANLYFEKGNAVKNAGDPDAALVLYRKAMQIKPDFKKPYMAMYHQLQHLCEWQKIEPMNAKVDFITRAELEQGIKTSEMPLMNLTRHADPALNYSVAASWGKAVSESIQEVVTTPPVPLSGVAYLLDEGLRLYNMRKPEEAIAVYQKVLEIQPDNSDAYNNIGLSLQMMGRTQDAILCYQKAVECKPDNIGAYLNMGNSLRYLGRFEELIAAYRKALEYKPDYVEAFVSLFHQLQYVCDWKSVEQMNPQMDKFTQAFLDNRQKTMEMPFVNLTRCDNPERNYAIAKSWSDDIANSVKHIRIPFSYRHLKESRKITVAYMSGEFCNHPVAHLISGLFQYHDRNEFEIICYAYGKDDGSDYRKQIARDCDRFIDIKNLSYAEAAQRIHQDKVMILVELMGFTGADNRLAICALRPAPIQVSYLGFPGTSGADFFDYIITDKIVSPPEHAKFYSEKLVYMPHCYQVNNNGQIISDKPYCRKDFGLPQNAFVFCSFNQPYKIEPIMFDVWMRILKQIPNSVLWLLWKTRFGEANLRKEAEKRGVSEHRLIFSQKMPKAEHLGRHKLADLVLDTRLYNGHTTTSDALWAGVPVITLEGNHFASRVSSSLLRAIGLSELIAENLSDYERLALYMASNPNYLNMLRQKLAKNRLTEPLFDTPRFAKNLENAYRMMWRNCLEKSHDRD